MYDRILLRKRSVIETINDELKNVAQLVHSRRCSDDISEHMYKEKVSLNRTIKAKGVCCRLSYEKNYA